MPDPIAKANTLSGTVSVRAKGATDEAGARVAAAGGLIGALAASACCILPLMLFGLGIGGAWIGQLTALAPYKPLFIAVTFGFLGYGYWLTYRRPAAACREGDACSRPLPNRVVKTALWGSTALVGLAIVWPYALPLVLG